MKPDWEKHVFITASNHESGHATLRIVMGATGPRLVLVIGDKHLVIATCWTPAIPGNHERYVTDHTKQLIEAITEGVEQLKKGPS